MGFDKSYGKVATGPLNFPMLDSDARELEKMLDSGEYSKFEKHSTTLESFSPGERADISIINDGSVDADGEIISPKGINWDRFKKNPLVTYKHNYEMPPIGKSLWQKLIGDSVWKAKTQYAGKPQDFPETQVWFADSIYHLVKEGFLPGKSISGITKFRQPNDTEKGARRVGYETVVYEYAIVPLQANKNAIVEMVSKGLVKVPKNVLSLDFPELDEIVNESIPVIKDFRTSDDYLKEQEELIKNKILEVYQRSPVIVDDAFDVMMGRV